VGGWFGGLAVAHPEEQLGRDGVLSLLLLRPVA
jgi:hypothetical protein